jgi:signal peptidase I
MKTAASKTGWMASRNWRKRVKELARHARHLRHTREDVMATEELATLDGAIATLQRLYREGPDGEGADAALQQSDAVLDRLTPRRWKSSIRENLDVALVAIGVAMAFRAYILQPFKIPTGSMQPTLMGIYSNDADQPTLMDRLPFKLVKWAVTGEWYYEVRAQQAGVITDFHRHPKKTWVRSCHISGDSGTVTHKLPNDAVVEGRVKVRLGQTVQRGDLIWAGHVTRGDHVFVNKILWNFRLPRRGEIMVFETDGIPSLPPGTHYIKRMSGLPGEHLEIKPPNLLIDGKVVTEPATIRRIAEQQPGYSGYQYVDPRSSGRVSASHPFIQLEAAQYVALGDNTLNSRDSRYWGHVPAVNLVGPAAGIYWPFSKRWGLAR